MIQTVEIPTKTGGDNFQMPILGLGTWMMGGSLKRDLSNNDERDILAVRNAVAAGIKHIDTAEMYAAGYTETLVGKAIADIPRQTLLLVSKVMAKNLQYDKVLYAVEQTLKRLGTDYLDLYLIHSPNDEIPLKQTMRAMNRLLDEKTIKHAGVSNFSVQRTEEALALADRPLALTQVHYNLIYREPELSGLLAYCAANQILVEAWRPVQKGLFTKGHAPLLDEIADKYQKTPAQIAINWLLSKPNIVTLSTMRSPEHLAENLAALCFSLTQEDQNRLTDEFPGQQVRSDTVPLL